MRFLPREPGLSSFAKTRENVMGSLHEGGTVGAMLITAIKRFADRPAIADDQTRWTYRELGRAAGGVVALFRSLGLKKGGGVSLLATNRVETWAVVTAAAVMGLRYKPLHPLAAEDDHAFIVDDAEADVLIIEGAKFAERGRSIKRRAPRLKQPFVVRTDGGRARPRCGVAVHRGCAVGGRGRGGGDLLARLHRCHDRALEGRHDRAPLHSQHDGDHLR